MSDVYVQTEECYCKMPRNCFDYANDPDFINADELVDVLNSVKEDGPDRRYVVLEEQ
jgi:hypothetical protein